MQIGIQYVGGLLEETELQEIRAIAKSHGFELKEDDIGGRPFMHGADLAGFVLFLSPALLEAIAAGVISSASYDALKTIVANVARSISGKSYTVVTPGNNFTEKKAKFFINGERANLQIEIPSENTEAIHSVIQEVVGAFKDANKSK